MSLSAILEELKSYSDENTKKTLLRHGAREPFFGVKVADLKKILKKTKKNHKLSLELYNTGNSDAMYLAGLMADEKTITRQQLNEWVEKAYWYYLSEFTVPWVAGETAFGFELGLEWIDSNKENVAAAGWSTLAYFAAMNPDENLDITQYRKLLERVASTIESAQNRVRYAMNGFVIAIGTYIIDLTSIAQQTANKIGKVDVVLAGAACKVPLATDYIQKVIDSKRLGIKRKTARC